MNRNKKIATNFIKNEITKSFWINRFINKLTIYGEKSKVEKVLYLLTKQLKLSGSNFILNLFYSFELVRPIIFTKPYTMRGKLKLIPSRLGVEEQYSRAVSWIANSIRTSKEKTFSARLLREIFKLVLLKRGKALKQKKHLYRTVIKNRTFINFRT